MTQLTCFVQDDLSRCGPLQLGRNDLGNVATIDQILLSQKRYNSDGRPIRAKELKNDATIVRPQQGIGHWPLPVGPQASVPTLRCAVWLGLEYIRDVEASKNSTKIVGSPADFSQVTVAIQM